VSRIEQALKKMEDAQKSQPNKVGTSILLTGADGLQVDERVVAYHRPVAALTENFKQFNTVIRAMTQGAASTLAFTSASKGEGKSVVTLNFAVALARDCEGSVCIVDADLRNPSLHRLMGMHNAHGIADVLEGKLAVEDAPVPTPVEKLFLIPAGNIPPNPSELFGSRRAAQVIGELRSRFEYVVFDTASVLPAADTIHLATQLDGVVIVVQAGGTSRKQVARAIELLGHANVLGFILNKSEREKSIKEYA